MKDEGNANCKNINSPDKTNYKFMITAVILSYIFCCLFYFQATMPKPLFDSDTKLHISMTDNQISAYSLLHKVVYTLTEISLPAGQAPIKASVLIMPIVLALSVFFSILIIHHYFCSKYPDKSPYLTGFLSFALIFVSMIIYNPYNTYLYISTGSPNVWHNPTMIFSRTFGILTFICVLQMYNKYKLKEKYVKEIFFLLLFSTLSMWAKPSFLTSFLPAVAILFICLYFKGKISFKFLSTVGLSLLPSFIPFLFIKDSLFDNKMYVVFAFAKVWSYFSANIPLSILLAAAFPLYVFVINIKRLSFALTLSFINYIISLLIYLCLAEQGYRMYHANMIWGYLFGIFFVFLFASEEFFLKRQYPLAQKITGWILFMMHFLSGIFYFIKIMSGRGYL